MFVDTLRSPYERIMLVIMLTDEYRYKILKIVEAKPDISQRDLARELGISLGKVNFCLKALIEKGLLKATNFRNNQNKLAYMYLLTPHGIEEKSTITLRFLKAKMEEYAVIQKEINMLMLETKVDTPSEVNFTSSQSKKPI